MSDGKAGLLTMKNKLYVGIDIGGTKISAGLVKSSGKVIARYKLPTPKGAGPKAVISVLAVLVEDILSGNDLRTNDLRGIGIGVPGIVRENGEIIVTPNINLSGFNIIRALRSKYRLKISCGNDVNLGLLAEKWIGAASSAENVLGIFPGTGVGGGIIIDGRLITGSSGAAAEIGHMVMDINGPKCGCGNRGCLEAMVSRRAIERDIRESIKRGEKSVVQELTGGSLSLIKSKVLSEALKAEDPVVVKVMRRMSEVLGLACVSLRHILDPELILLGGGVVEACADFILPVVIRSLKEDKFFSRVSECRVAQSKLGDDAVFLGAAALVMQK